MRPGYTGIESIYQDLCKAAKRLAKGATGGYPFKNAVAGGYRFAQWRGKKPSEAKNLRDTAIRIQRGLLHAQS